MENRKQSDKVISSRKMRALEINSEYFGISLLQLMENAGKNVAQEIALRFPSKRKVTIFCGLGGNGGDGFVAARHLLSLGFQISVIIVGKSKLINHKASLKNWNVLKNLSDYISITEISDSSDIPNVNAEIIIDAILGTGNKGKLRQPVKKIVEFINTLDAEKVSIDIPTGLDADTGETLSATIKPNLTITFHKIKPGLIHSKYFCGEIIVSDIGLPLEFEKMVGPGDVSLVSTSRALNSHKGDFGTLLVIGGSTLFSGAPVLSSLSGLRTGVDVVYTASPEKTAFVNAAMSPNLITIKLKGKHVSSNNLNSLSSFIKKSDAIVLGPGLGIHEETFEFVDLCIDEIEKLGKPLILDADGINAFSTFKRSLSNPFVITPHIGEFKKLSGNILSKNFEKRIKEVREISAKLNAVVVLKCEKDIISDSNRTKINYTGNPGMTVGGTGDVLSGIIGGLVAQKNDLFESAVAGAYINGAAGDFVAEKIGYHLLATDLLDWIPRVLENPMSHIKVKNRSGCLS